MTCPVCHHKQNTPLLTLEDYPVYQHPMVDNSKIPLPHTITLKYLICAQCAHAFQSNYDRDILEKIYSYHYYTPSPDSVGATFRNEFIDFIKQQSAITKHNANILEIGCSSGDVLSALKSLHPQFNYRGIEPNEETAKVARKRGFDISSEFFTQKFVQTFNNKVDLIYSRHVIEHIFDFDDFFNAATQISNNDTLLILETPSLDWATQQTSTAAFHVEHIHVFSERSLVILANRFGWFKDNSTVTTSGNLIVSFSRIDNIQQLPITPKKQKLLQTRNDELVNKMQTICKNKRTIFWGAGSAAIKLMLLSKLTPSYIIDGNPNKKGKFFCGMNLPISYAPDVIKRIIAANEDKDIVMIISSSYYREIEKQLKQLGWKGIIYAPYRNEKKAS